MRHTDYRIGHDWVDKTTFEKFIEDNRGIKMYYDDRLFAGIFSNELSEESKKDIDKIIESLQEGNYILGDLIVGVEYPIGSLDIAVNPVSCPQQGPTTTLTPDDLKELTALSNLLKANSNKHDSDSRVNSHLYGAYNAYKTLKETAKDSE